MPTAENIAVDTVAITSLAIVAETILSRLRLPPMVVRFSSIAIATGLYSHFASDIVADWVQSQQPEPVPVYASMCNGICGFNESCGLPHEVFHLCAD
jgi:hypothetical protein